MATSRRLTLPVRAINGAARQDPTAVTRLTQAAQRVKAAQLAGRAAELPKALEVYRAALALMEDRAVASLEAAGRPVTTAMRMRIRRTLTAAAVGDSADRTALRQGRLSHELAPRGFDVFGPSTRALRLLPKTSTTPTTRPAPPATSSATAADDPRRRRARELVRLRTVVATARTRLGGLEARARALERTAVRLATSALTARQRAEEARQAADAAGAAVREARATLDAAEAALWTAEPPA
jgi:hypothetical protein